MLWFDLTHGCTPQFIGLVPERITRSIIQEQGFYVLFIPEYPPQPSKYLPLKIPNPKEYGGVGEPICANLNLHNYCSLVGRVSFV